ncbi:hypothetical protein [Pontibacter sp. H249]|uniref:hypothetical protein n=1 Tax=Pontibacter sp. H249 TaxID=3133420 RepID=UPI0030C13B00
MSTALTIKHPESAGVVQYQSAGSLISFLPTQKTTPADLQIIQAMNGRKVSAVNDAELDMVITRAFNKALLLLGHKHQWGAAEEQTLLLGDLNRLLRQRYSYYTIEEVDLVFSMGARGELKVKPTDIVFLNIEQISSWLRVYKNDCKAKAIQTCNRIEELPRQRDYKPLSFLQEGVEKAASDALTEDDLTHLTGCYYDRFKKAKAFSMPSEKMWEIYHEERTRTENAAIASGEAFEPGKKIQFKAYKASLEKGVALSDNMFEQKAQGAYRRRIMKAELELLAFNETDISTLEI